MMKKSLIAISAIAMSVVMTVSCGSDDNGGGIVIPPVETASFTLELSNLEELGAGLIYEGWLIVDGSPVSTGTFTGAEAMYTFNAIKSNLDDATKFVVSIEPVPDTDPDPAATKVLSGDFVGNRANITLDEIADFSSVSGSFEIFTPSDVDDTNEENGVWFITRNAMDDSFEAGLTIPTLPNGWKYEGWVVINDVPVSTGTFTDPGSFDDSSPYSGNNPAVPAFPGEDFISSSFTSGTTTLTFPADGDVTGKNVVISVEPDPDNDPAPFFIKPLVGTAGQDVSPTTNMLSRDAISLSVLGTVTR